MSNSDSKEVRSRAPIALDDCGMAAAAEIVGDRWTLLILREAFYSVVRYDDILEDLGISRSILSDRLARLVQKDVLERRPYREPGERERMAYFLTPRGQELAVVMLALLQWGNRSLPQGPQYAIAKQSDGSAVEVGLLDKKGRRVDPAKITIAPVSE